MSAACDPARPFLAPYHPVRAVLLRRGLYLLLAFDAWLVMLEHGGRYGAGGFNVAHFAWLDALVGVPTPGLYVGLLVAAGLWALTLAFVRPAWPEKLGLALIYTASWAISLHDSYQHHYLLSWLLLWCAVLPEPSCADARDPAAPPRRAIGLSLGAFTCAIVYAFTALSKTSAEWRSGAVLARITGGELEGAGNTGLLGPLIHGASELTGSPARRIYALLSWSLVGVQLVIALAYAVSPGRDLPRPGAESSPVSKSKRAGTRASKAKTGTPSATGWRTLRARLCGLGLLCAGAFHLTAELAHVFEIGWFSYYMLWTALTLLAPAGFLSLLARVLAPRTFTALWERVLARGRGQATLAWASALLSALLLTCGVRLDLPGALAGCGALAALLAGVAWRCALRGQVTALAPWMRAAGLACLALWASVGLTQVRFDFYRRWAGELVQLGELEQALALYRKAEDHAPPGKSRARRIEQLERQLGERTAPKFR
jgi:hypothetical protein